MLFTVSLLFSFGIAEGVLRIAGYPHLNPSQRDLLLGWSLEPNVEGWVDGEARVFYKTNSHGMRDVEHEILKTPGVVRVAVLGDSFTEGYPVSVEESFCQKMGLELVHRRAFGGAGIEILNFGVVGYGTTQEWLALKTRVWQFSPDIVLLAFYAGNDLRENSEDFCAKWSTSRPFYRVSGRTISLDTSFLALPPFSQPLEMALRKVVRESNSRFIRLLANLKRIIEGAGSNPPVTPDFNLAIGKDDSIFSEPKTPSWDKAWKVTEALIDSMNRESGAHHARFLVATLTTYEQVDPDLAARRRLEERLGVTDLFYADRRIREICERRGISVKNLAPDMQAYADSCHVYLHGFPNSGLGIGHWNAKGHAAAGSLLAQFLDGQVRLSH